MSRRFWQMSDVAPPLEQPERRVLRDVFGSGGSKSNTVTTNSSAAPWSGVQPYLLNLFSGAGAQYQQGPYSGQYLANESPYTAQARQMMAARGAAGSPVTSAMQQNLTDTLNGKYLDPSSNQYLSQSVNDALGQAKSQYVGMYGGNAGSQLANSGFQEGLQRNLANTALPIYAQNYTNERNNQMQAAAMAPNAAAVDYQNIGAIGGAGASQEARQQAEIQAAQQQYYAPWQNLAYYQQALSGNFGGQQTQQTPYFTNPLSSMLGLGLGGASLYKMLSGGGSGGGAGGGVSDFGGFTGLDSGGGPSYG